MPKPRFCPNCNQNVVPIKNRTGGIVIASACFLLGLILPLWPITLPLFWILGLVVLLVTLSKSATCPMCNAPKRQLQTRQK